MKTRAQPRPLHRTLGGVALLLGTIFIAVPAFAQSHVWQRIATVDNSTVSGNSVCYWNATLSMMNCSATNPQIVGGNLGIGTTGPLGTLDVEGSGGVFLNAGNVGVGTTTLGTGNNAATLTVQSNNTTYQAINAISSGSSYGAGFQMRIAGVSSGLDRWLFETRPSASFGNPTTDGWYVRGVNTDGSAATIPIMVTNTGNILLAAATSGTNGNVGIGTTFPQSKLHIQAGEVQVGSSSASCSGSNAGAIRYAGGTLYYCDNANTWESIDSSGTVGSADYVEVTSTAPNPTGTMQGYLGASSTLGAILSGQGSTADVTLENKNGNIALEIPTGTTNVYLPGNVGIGTTSPGAALQVKGANYNAAIISAPTYPTLTFNSGSTAFGTIGSGNITGAAATDLGIQSSSGDNIYFAAGGTAPQLKITTGGTLSMTIANVVSLNNNGATDPLFAFDISGTQFGTFGSAGSALSGGTATDMAFQTASGNNILFATGGTALSNVRMYIASGGNVGIGTTSPGSSLQVNGGAAIGYSTSASAPSNGLAVSGTVGIGTTTPATGVTMDVSGSVKIAQTGSEVCTPATIGQIRWNAAGYMEMCTP